MKPSYPTPIDMGHEVYAIDLMEQNQPFRTAAYLIKDEKITLIETGSGASHHALLAGLSSLGITPEELDYIIVTHVHLDHAGGAGQLMDIAPKATLVVHPRGAKHMIDPTRLWEGATQVYGDKVSQLFGSVVPVAAHRVLVREHGETLTLGSRTLTFFDSPGHAKHHFTMLDNRSHALFAGDAVGIRYVTGFTHWNFDFIMPSSSPVDFDIQALHATLSMLEAIPFEWVYHAHFGRSPKSIAIEQTLRFGDKFSQLIAKHYRPELPVDELVNLLRGMVVDTLTEDGHHSGPIEVLDFDMYLDAMGLLVYQSRTQR